jgi:hypothetical protein
MTRIVGVSIGPVDSSGQFSASVFGLIADLTQTNNITFDLKQTLTVSLATNSSAQTLTLSSALSSVDVTVDGFTFRSATNAKPRPPAAT